MGSIMTLDLFPLGIVLLVAVTAASAAYFSLRRAKLGRRRHALAYLAGFLAGLTATLGATILPALAITDTPIAQAGMLASFFAPFAGIVHAELRKLAEEESALLHQPPSPAQSGQHPKKRGRTPGMAPDSGSRASGAPSPALADGVGAPWLRESK
jgi:hypothetical protein